MCIMKLLRVILKCRNRNRMGTVGRCYSVDRVWLRGERETDFYESHASTNSQILEIQDHQSTRMHLSSSETQQCFVKRHDFIIYLPLKVIVK